LSSQAAQRSSREGGSSKRRDTSCPHQPKGTGRPRPGPLCGHEGDVRKIGIRVPERVLIPLVRGLSGVFVKNTSLTGVGEPFPAVAATTYEGRDDATEAPVARPRTLPRRLASVRMRWRDLVETP